MQLIKVFDQDVAIRGTLVRMARLDADKHHFLDRPESFIEALRVSRKRIDVFSFMQKVSEPTPKYSYPLEWDNLAVLSVQSFEHWWKNQIRSYPRNRARQAEKRGVILREAAFDDNLVRGIWEVYNECPVRQGRAFRHYGKDLETVRKEEATFLDSSIFIGAFLQAKLIGFAKLVYDEAASQANLMNIVSMVSHKDKAPTNALIAQAVRSCERRGIKYLVYQSFAYGQKNGDSLSHFKEVNGFTRVDLPRYYVPVTPLGGVALRLGWHKRISERVPEKLLTPLRELRSKWYGYRFQAAKEESAETA